MANGIGRVGWRNFVSTAPTTASIITTGLVLNLDASNPLSYSGTGTTWTNLSGSGSNGTLVNGTGYSSSNGGTMVFDGVNDYTSFPNDTALDSQTITMESWVYLNGTLNQAAFVFEKGSVNSQYSNFFYSDGMFLFRTQGLSNLDLKITSSSYMSANAWNHIICTYALGVKSIYVNGVLANQITGVTGTIPTNNFGLFLGCYYNSGAGPTFFLNGKIAISRAYNIALTSTQVQQNFNAEKARFGFTNYTTRTTAFATATGITDTTILNALNTFDTGLISNGLDTKMKALYPFVGGTANTHKYNFMDARDVDAAYRLVFNGGWVHSSTGAQPNGTNAYSNTFFSLQGLTQNNSHMSIYNTNDYIPGVPIDMGAFDENAGNGAFIATEIAVNLSRARMFKNAMEYNNSDNRGYFLVNSNSTNSQYYINNVNRSTIANSGNFPLSNLNIYIGALNGTNSYYYANGKYTFSTIGNGLTDAEASALYTLTQALQTTLGRQV